MSKTTFAALSRNMAAVNTTMPGATAASTTPTNRADMPNAMALTRLARSTRLPMKGESRPANSPIMRATPICPTDTSKPRAMTATNGGAKR
ncbi:MAG: hypothetical protein EBS48_04775 [Actinobacteria bacterium]|nr:hypothetical protein [Actinomycetota bacterium]